jgi:hypothetical protein
MTHAMESAEPLGHSQFIECTECRSPRRDRYYVLNERPVCAKCRVQYDRMIQSRDGRFAMGLVTLKGGLVALAGAVALMVIETVFPAARIFVLIPIGFFVGKRIMSAVAHYSARRFQYLAVALTYASFMIGMAVPAIREASDTRKVAHAKNERAAMQRALAEVAAELQTNSAQSTGKPESAHVEATRSEPTRGVGSWFLLVLAWPVLRMFQFGMGMSTVGILALGVALFQAWKQTDGQGMDLKLRGPFRVGDGPIAAR